jgi:hypothetical protein
MERIGCPSRCALSISSRFGCGQIVHVKGIYLPLSNWCIPYSSRLIEFFGCQRRKRCRQKGKWT